MAAFAGATLFWLFYLPFEGVKFFRLLSSVFSREDRQMSDEAADHQFLVI